MSANRLQSGAPILLATALVFLAACSQPAEDILVAEPIEAAGAVFRSAKRVSSDCGIVKAPDPVPGMAPAMGVAIEEMPPPIAKNLSVGADRVLQQTDHARVAPGYVLIEPVVSRESMLLDVNMDVVATFQGDYFTSHTEFLPHGGRLAQVSGYTDRFKSGGRSGCLEEYSAAGDLLWRINLNTDRYINHHDFFRMDNGNVLALVWESVTTDEAVYQGRDPANVSESGDFWYDGVIEINPYTQEIVWEWSARHHIVQEFDAGKPNFDVVSDHPELIDINKFQRDRRDDTIAADWTHVNSIDYNAELDQIVLSSNFLSEIWVIDHSTTPRESMGHSGGRYGKGGDLIFRWGNPANYNRGSEADQKLFHQHDAQWIREGLNGAGNLLIFNNGDPELRPYSTVVELAPEMSPDGGYVIGGNGTYGPESPVWEYDPQPPERFFSFFISGAQRLANGNTLINQGAGARVREVTAAGEIVWDYEYVGPQDAPYMLFRANKYPPDHPGITAILTRAP